MPTYNPENQFEQYVVDSFETITTQLKQCPKQIDKLEAVDDRVTVLESDKAWYKRIFVFVWGAIGGGLVLFIKNLLKGQ